MNVFSIHIRQAQMVLFFTVALLAGLPLPGVACEITIVKSADLKPYQDVIRGIRDAGVCDIREATLDGVEGPETVLREKTSAVIAVGTVAFRRVRNIRDLPVLYVMVVPAEIERSLSPNISGVSMDPAPRDYLAAMREVLPDAKRIAVLYDPLHTKQFVDEAVKAARDVSMDLVVRPVRGSSGVPGALEGLRSSVDLLWMLPDPAVTTAESVEYLLRYSISRNVPVFTFSRKYVDMGAVASLDVDPYDMGVQVAELAKGAISGGRWGVHAHARKTRVTFNVKTAAKMGIKPADLQPEGRTDGR